MPYLGSDDFRVLSAIETGMRNHEMVPAKMVCAIAELRSGSSKVLRNLCYNRLVSYERGKRYDGYRLTNLGYDYLALRVLRNRGNLTEVGNQIGVGKEASVYIAANRETGDRFALKVHRLGRTSFKTVFSKRDYHRNRVCNWLYMSRLAALREFAFMKALHKEGFAVPKPIDNNRHCVLMDWINGTLLNNVSTEDAMDHEHLFAKLMDMILELANKYGVVHGDFNEFNILIENRTDQPILIDFPQMVPTTHRLAREYFERDVKCIVNFFEKRFNYVANETLSFDDVEIDEQQQSYIHRGVEDAEFLHQESRGQEEIIAEDEEEEKKREEEEEEEKEEEDLRQEKENNQRKITNLNKSDQQSTNSINDQQVDLFELSSDDQFEDCADLLETKTKYIASTSTTTSMTTNSIVDPTVNKTAAYLDAHAEMLNKMSELGLSMPERSPCRQDGAISGAAVASEEEDDDRLSMISHTAASRFGGGSSVASSFTADEIRGKLRKEKDRKIKRELIQNTFRKVKGDSSAVGRKRSDNKYKIREDASIYEMF